VLAVPTAVLVVVALATWRLDRRLRRDAAELDRAARRLASLRSAVAALAAQVDDAGRRHDELGASR
jgi:pilus assembly protein TadC